MAATLWEPDDVTSYCSVWAAGLNITATTPTESDVLVVSLNSISPTNSYNGSTINFDGSALTASDYATYLDGEITISQSGVYEVTYNSVVTPSVASTFESTDTYLFLERYAPTGSYEFIPSYAPIHGISQAPIDNGDYVTRANYSDTSILIVTTAPVTFTPTLGVFNYSASGTYSSQLTVIVRRSGDLAA